MDANFRDIIIWYDANDCEKIQRIPGFKLSWNFRDTVWNEYGRLYIDGIYLRFLAVDAKKEFPNRGCQF